MEKTQRKPTRLKDYDYSSQGYYFITICTKGKAKILCDIVEEGLCALPNIRLSNYGEIANNEIQNIDKHYDNVKIDKYVIMPNHIHLIVQITERINPFPTIKCDISNIVGKFKAAVTRNVGKAFMPSAKENIWQTSFHDHIIRGEEDYLKIWNYIDTNPQKWKEDCFYSD